MKANYLPAALYFLAILCLSAACSENESQPELASGCGSEGLMESFIDPEGNNLFIYEDGGAYLQTDGECDFELQYFDPGFEGKNYEGNASGVFLRDGSDLIAVKNNFAEDFESESSFINFFKTDVNDPNLFWTNFTLQSPSAKQVSEYVALSKCILDQSCDFLDNRIDLVDDPADTENQVIRFSSVAPTVDMVTSKCSLTSLLTHFGKGTDLWFEAKYYIENGLPFSLVDFESSYFEKSPGPRVIIKNGKLALDNKFGAKLQYLSDSQTSVPSKKWFTIKVHLKFSNTSDGLIQLWQDGELLISTEGITLQTSNGLQNILEIGISATQQEATVLMDDIRISETDF